MADSLAILLRPSGQDVRTAYSGNEALADSMMAQCVAIESERRKWILMIAALLELHSHDSDPSDRVQAAFDCMHIAACESAIRILRTVGPAEWDPPLYKLAEPAAAALIGAGYVAYIEQGRPLIRGGSAAFPGYRRPPDSRCKLVSRAG